MPVPSRTGQTHFTNMYIFVHPRSVMERADLDRLHALAGMALGTPGIAYMHCLEEVLRYIGKHSIHVDGATENATSI